MSYSPFQSLLHDFHVQHPEETAAEAEAEGIRGLRFKEERRVVQRQLCQRIAEVLEIVGGDGEHARIDLRFGPRETRQRGDIHRTRGHQGVSHRCAAYLLDAGHYVTDLARRQRVAGLALWREAPDIVDHVRTPNGLRQDPITLLHGALHDAHQ